MSLTQNPGGVAETRARHTASATAATVFLSLLLLLATLVFFLLRSWHGLWFLPFADESDHLLGGRVIDAGGRLYASYIDSHGPLIFMLTQAYGAVFGWSAPNGARLILTGLFLAAGGGLALSPALAAWPQRLLAASLFLGLSASLWLVQGFYLVSYYPLSGALAAIGLAGFVVGAWTGARFLAVAAAVAGVAFGLLVFTAYSYGPSALLFALSGGLAAWRSGERRAVLVMLAAGLLTGLAGLLWLLRFGDVVGYLTYHIVFNQTAYAPFIDFTFGHFLRNLLPTSAPLGLVNTLGVVAWLVSCVVFLVVLPRQWLAVLLGHLGVVLLNLRGMIGFQNGTFLVASFALLALALPLALARLPMRPARSSLVGTLLVGLCNLGAEATAHKAELTPFGLTYAQGSAQPAYAIDQRIEIPALQALRRIIPRGEPVLALPYWPDFYFNLDRLPPKGFYEYLPWDAAYARAPWFGRRRDLCGMLQSSPPPLIAVQDAPVWGRYTIWQYAPCLRGILESAYRRIPGYPYLYLRRDRVPAPGTPAALPLGIR
jgi:hypothetical protein